LFEDGFGEDALILKEKGEEGLDEEVEVLLHEE
jgi:hypothetical protein